ncbi:hypothetical protein C0991_009589 [Blastosporella zonata]|nr:hypothetical protein C0991_009589 [Blastosporella zonata]
MPENLQVVIDSIGSDELVYTGGPNGGWVIDKDMPWFGGSSAWSSQIGAFPVTSGSLNITFSGNTVAFYGYSPPLELYQEMTVTIDENHPWNTSFPTGTAGSYCQWWQSPVLEDGTHSIRLDGLTQTSLDFMAVTVSNSSLAAGAQIIVDDADPELIYTGDWNLITRVFPVPGENFNAAPFHNTTHQSNTVGDSAAFHFTGPSLPS